MRCPCAHPEEHLRQPTQATDGNGVKQRFPVFWPQASMGELRAPCRYQNSIRPRIKIHGGTGYIRFGIQYIEFLSSRCFCLSQSEDGRIRRMAPTQFQSFPLLDGNSESSDREYLAKRLAARNGGGGLPLPGSRPPFQVPAVESLAVQAHLDPTPDACAHADSTENKISGCEGEKIR